MPQSEPLSPSSARSTASPVWYAVSVRVAWELHRQKIRVTRDTLDAARDHVFLSLPADAPATLAERLASPLTQDFVARIARHRYQEVTPHERLPDRQLASLRRTVEKACDPAGLYVLRLHYGERWPLSTLGPHINIPVPELNAVREGLRALTRLLLEESSLDEGLGTVDALDSALSDIALAPYGVCPEPQTLLDPEGRDHAEGCPRCGRAVRLLQAGVLVQQDLIQPGPAPQQTPTTALALQIHPDSESRNALLHQFPGNATPAGEDFILLDVTNTANWQEKLTQRIRVGQPQGNHIRGAVQTGQGRWIARGLLGPVATDVLDKTRAQPWGQIEGLENLPDTLPPPPSVTRWWSLAILTSTIAILAGLALLRPTNAQATYPMTGSQNYSGGAISVTFDVNDRAHLGVWAIDTAGRVDVVLDSEEPAAKSELATRRGDFEIVTVHPRLLIASSDTPMPELPEILQGLSGVEKTSYTGELVERVTSLYPGAEVRYFDISQPKHTPF